MACKETTSRVAFHFNDLVIRNDTLVIREVNSAKEELFHAIAFLIDFDQQLYTILLDRELQAGKFYELSVRYLGVLNDDLVGFYRSSYNDSASGAQRLASALFSSLSL